MAAPPARPPHARDRRWLHSLLLLLTFGTTMLIGANHYVAFQSDFGTNPLPDGLWGILMRGAWYSLTILAILGAHEMGHYLTCRYYRVDASLPYFIPAPIILTGTLGAFIRIRQPIPTKWMLFDIGVAGPIAGFVVAVPALFVGLSLSRMSPLPEAFEGFWLGEPLLFQAAAWLIWGAPADGYSLNMHPMAFAAWFGLLATALNLFPVGQLDGGHISYAALGRRSTLVTYVSILTCVVLTILVSLSWLVWTVLLLVMLFVFGPRHPRTIDEDIPLDPARRRVAAFAVFMFIVSFTPAPIEPFALIQGQ